MPDHVLVLGASGKVGSQLCRRLSEEGVAVRAFFDPGTSTLPAAELPVGVEEIHADFADEVALRRACEGASAVFALTPPSESQTRWQRAIVAAAVAGGSGRIVKLSAFESGKDSPLAMGRWHHEGEVAVAQSGLPYAILRPQYFMQNQLPALRAAAGSGVLRGAAAPSLRLGIVDASDVAAVAAVALTRLDLDGQILIPTGRSALSFEEMATALATLLGREVRYEQRPHGEIEAEFEARGWPRWHIDDYFLIHGAAASDLTTDDVERTTGRAPVSFDAFLRAHAAQLDPETAR